MRYLIIILVFISSFCFGQEVPIYGNADIYGSTYVRDTLKVDSSVTFPGLTGTGTFVGINAAGRLSKTTATPTASSSFVVFTTDGSGVYTDALFVGKAKGVDINVMSYADDTNNSMVGTGDYTFIGITGSFTGLLPSTKYIAFIYL